MDNWPRRTQEFVDGLAASVAIVGRGEAGELVVSACNEKFLEMSGGQRGHIRSFPVSIDALIPSYARHELRGKLQECFDTGHPQEWSRPMT